MDIQGRNDRREEDKKEREKRHKKKINKREEGEEEGGSTNPLGMQDNLCFPLQIIRSVYYHFQ